jgi:hypothetical protein
MIVAIAGPHNTGKDVVASFLTKHYGFIRISWADELCRVVSHKYGLPYQRLLGLTPEDRQWRITPNPSIPGLQQTPLTPLEVLNLEGDGSRAVQQDVWVNHLLNHIKGSSSNWVIPGTRRLNEAEAVLKRQGSLWYINRPNTELSAVEEELPLVKQIASVVIENSSTLEELESKVINLVEQNFSYI